MKILSEHAKEQDCYAKLADDNSKLNVILNSNIKGNTDRWFLFVFIFCSALLVPLLAYPLIYSDVNRYNGYDGCGNICGQKNDIYDQWNCTGQDMTYKVFFVFSDCMNEQTYNYHNYSSWHIRENVVTNLESFVSRFAIAIFAPFGISLILAFIFRLGPALAVWMLVTTCWLTFPASYGFIWLYLCLGGIGVYIIITGLIVQLSDSARGKIVVVVTLLQESSRAVFAVRNITSSIAVTSAITFTIVLGISVMTFCLKTSGILTEIAFERLDYIPDCFMIIANAISIMIAFWMIRFVIGVGSLNTSVTIANRYFSRIKETNFCQTSKNHLGTVAMVSLLSTVMVIPRIIVMALAQFTIFKDLMDFVLWYLNGYFSKNVYIVTAMEHTSFTRSGKKAVEIFKSSMGNTESACSFGECLIVLSQIIVVVACTLISYFLHGEDLGCVLDFFLILAFSYTSTELVLGPVKVVLNTIFFCVCQDNLLKKQTKEPYNLSREEYLIKINNYFVFKIKEKCQSRDLSTT